MKKILTALGMITFVLGYSQNGTLILNNYSAYDFSGYILANNFAGGCFPSLISSNPEMVKVPANSNMNNGNELKYANYRDQYTSSLYPMTQWFVYTSSTGGLPRLWSHAAIMPGGVISNNTKWASTKFVMYYPGTTTLAPDNFNGSLTLAANVTCYTAPDIITTASGNMAEIFTITGGGTNFTYIQLF